ncbi:MAG TPA: FAD-dependent oxidoreductase, partial [bacterium]|nr:FAD-dependent oxidoreductase [bacterium]
MLKYPTRKENLLRSVREMEEGLTYTQAYNEACRCLLCHDAPCSKACPASTDPALFVRKLRFKNIKGAIRTIRKNNPLAGVCGVVCPTEVLCEEACSATGIDSAVKIGKIQRFLAEYGWKTGFDPLTAGKKNGKKAAVIGSGPAGLSCAAVLALEGFDVTVFESRKHAGGMMRYALPEYRLNTAFLNRELEDIKKLGVKIKLNSPVKDNGADKLLKSGYKAVFISTGLSRGVKPGIPGQDLANITTALEFLNSVRSMPSDIASKIKGRNAAIMGGGAVAVDCAVTCRGLGAKKVYIIYRRTEKEMPANPGEIRMAHDNFVIIKPQTTVTEFTGKNGRVTGLKGIELEWIKPGDFSSKNLRTVPGTEFSLPVDYFIFAIGL